MKENKQTKPLRCPCKTDGSPNTQDRQEKAQQRKAESKGMDNQAPPIQFEALMESQKLIANTIGNTLGSERFSNLTNNLPATIRTVED